MNVTQTLKIVLERTEIIVGKGENAGYQHFLPFSQCFYKLPFSRLGTGIFPCPKMFSIHPKESLISNSLTDRSSVRHDMNEMMLKTFVRRIRISL